MNDDSDCMSADELRAEVRRLRNIMKGLLIVLVNGELTLSGQRLIASDLRAALHKGAGR